jgi:hypothetical protein
MTSTDGSDAAVGVGEDPYPEGADLTFGFPSWEVNRHGICACGHRVVKHRGGWCLGVPTGRTRLHATEVINECACKVAKPVLMTADARQFQLSAPRCTPSHPFTVGYRASRAKGIEMTWLRELPLRCDNPECGETAGVRMVYMPGTGHRESVFACQVCAPHVTAF